MVFSRGIRKIGFEISGTFIFDNQELKIEEANDYGDFEYSLVHRSDKDFESYLKVIKNSIERFLDS